MSAPGLFEPRPKRPSRKRCLVEDLDPESQELELKEPAFKRRREETPILDWLGDLPAPPLKILTEISRSRSVPAELNDDQIRPTATNLREHLESLVAIDEMGDRRACNRQENRRDDDNDTQRTGKSTITRVKSISSKYRAVLEGNDVVIDARGNKISPTIRQFLDQEILKTRTSPPLSYEAVESTMTSMIDWGNSTENAVNGFINSHMFPVQRQGISVGGNSQWPTAALPFDPEYGLALSAPKPDYHVGYTPGIRSGFSKSQSHVIYHPYATPYTKPGTGNVLPFLTVELKSEATGGTLYQAENQAAKNGTYSLKAIDWLLDEANASQTKTQLDTIAFSMAGTGRFVVLSVHWYSPEDRIYYMSYVKGFQTTEPEHIQACHSTVKNIVDWAVGTRHKTLKEVLQTLFPLSHQWSEKRTAVAAELDHSGAGEKEEEVIVTRKPMAKRIMPEPSVHVNQSSQSFSSTQPLRSLGDRRTSTTKDTSVTRDSKPGKFVLNRK